MTTHMSGPLMVEGGVIGGSGPFGAPAGKTFFVNVNTPSAARNIGRPWYDVNGVTVFATLQAAINECVDDRGDVIYYARGYTTVTTPVLFNKAGISVIAQGFGMSPLSVGEYLTIDAAAAYTTGPVATVSKPCRIVGLGFSSRSAGAKACAMLLENVSAYPGWVHLLGCRFSNWYNNARYGINAEAGANNLIERCDFEAQATALTGGIAFGGSPVQNPIRNEVRECRFRGCTYAIDHVDGTPQEFLYKSNVVIDGKLLHSRNAAADGLVCDNWLETATDTGSYDVAVATMQGNGLNFSGNHYSE